MASVAEPTLAMREGHYIRKRDGMRVTAGDWSDGTVSWMLSPLPVISMGRGVGTCSLATFEKNYVPQNSDAVH